MSDKKQPQDGSETEQSASSNDKAGVGGDTVGDEQTAVENENVVNLDEKKAAPDPVTSDVDADKSAEQPTDPLTLLKDELAALKDKHLRLTADMENLRRRTEREKQEISKYAISNFARDVLSIDDNLQRTLQAVPEGTDTDQSSMKPLIEGVEMTSRELNNVLERYGIKKLNPEGEIFDPNLHQAMFEIENPALPVGTIIEVVATGYIIGERVLRPAMVGLAKGGEKPAKAESAELSNDKTAVENNAKAQTETEKVDKSV